MIIGLFIVFEFLWDIIYYCILLPIAFIIVGIILYTISKFFYVDDFIIRKKRE